MASTVMVCTHFERFRPAAIGITSSAIGVGSLAYPPLLRALVSYYGWRGALQLVGAITLNLVVCAGLYRPIQVPESPIPSIKERRGSLAQFQIFTEKSFVALCFSSVLICTGFSVVYVHLPAFAATLGIDGDRCALLLSMMGFGCIIGRLMAGLLNQIPAFNGFILYVLFFGLSGVCVISMPIGATYGVLMGLSVVFGVLTGCYGIAVIDIIIRILDVSRVGTGFGYVLLFMGIGQSIGGPLAGGYKHFVPEHGPELINSLAPGGFENSFQNVFFKLISWIDTLSNSCETALRSMPQNPSDYKSTLVQVMAWCRQAASHYLSQCCPRSLSPYGVTRPQWVKLTKSL